MNHLFIKYPAITLLLLLILVSCGKGYELRFANLYNEPMDSVVVGNNKLVFTDIQLQSTTAFESITKGKYSITCISQSKKKFYTSISIPGTGSGKRTVQLDGIEQFSILEE